MKRLGFTLLVMYFFTSYSFTQDWGTYLGRICEFDAENAIGLMDSGNFMITSEHISYTLNEDYTIDVRYLYTMKKMTEMEQNTFALSLRRRGIEGRRDEEINCLNVIVNGKKIMASFAASPYEIYDDNGIPVEVNWNDGEQSDRYFPEFVSNGYVAWYYFDVDFSESNGVKIEINYNAFIGYDHAMRYSSTPFWIPVSEDVNLTIIIENNCNTLFLNYIYGCKPLDTLITEIWNLEKPKENAVIVTYVPEWFSNEKTVRISFLDIYQKRATPIYPYFSVIWSGLFFGFDSNEMEGVFLGDIFYRRNNISLRELHPYELIFLNKQQLRIMRNAFYARYKYKFNDNELNVLFYTHEGNGDFDAIPSDNWFNQNFTEETLAPIERKNIEIIQRLENFVQ